MSRLGQLGRWLPALAWAALIAAFSTGRFSGEQTATVILPLLSLLLPGATPADLLALHRAVRKLAHFVAYLVLSVLLYRALRGDGQWSLRAAGLAFALAGLYAAGDEIHQWLVPNRTGSATDVLIDLSGAAAGQGLVAAWARALRR